MVARSKKYVMFNQWNLMDGAILKYIYTHTYINLKQNKYIHTQTYTHKHLKFDGEHTYIYIFFQVVFSTKLHTYDLYFSAFSCIWYEYMCVFYQTYILKVHWLCVPWISTLVYCHVMTSLSQKVAYNWNNWRYLT